MQMDVWIFIHLATLVMQYTQTITTDGKCIANPMATEKISIRCFSTWDGFSSKVLLAGYIQDWYIATLVIYSIKELTDLLMLPRFHTSPAMFKSNDTTLRMYTNVTVRSESGTLKVLNILVNNKTKAPSRNREDSFSSEENDKIVFPEDNKIVVERRKSKFKPVIPAHCKSKTFCDDVPNYPAEYIESVLPKKEEPFKMVDLIDESLTRRGGDPDEIELCDSKSTIIYPKAALSQNNTWVTIVNTPSFTQGYRVEICNEGSSRSCLRRLTPNYGFKAYCKQKWEIRPMKALSELGVIVNNELFAIPSCCACVLKVIDEDR